MISVGYYGKIPDRGDFISNNISTELEQAADRLGSSLVAHGRERYGDAFADIFAQMPLFALISGAGAIIDRAIAGVFGPSADAVGRLFPFFVLSESSDDANAPDAESITRIAALIDQAAFEQMALDDVESRLASISLAVPSNVTSIWLSQWSASGPQKISHEFKSFDDLCSRGLDLILTPQGAA